MVWEQVQLQQFSLKDRLQGRGSHAAKAAVPSGILRPDTHPWIQCASSDLLNRNISGRKWGRGEDHFKVSSICIYEVEFLPRDMAGKLYTEEKHPQNLPPRFNEQKYIYIPRVHPRRCQVSVPASSSRLASGVTVLSPYSSPSPRSFLQFLPASFIHLYPLLTWPYFQVQF